MDSIATIANMVREAEKHADALSQDRVRAIEYYQGEMHDTPADDGRSKLVTRDVRAQIKRVLPSILRTILGSEQVVEYLPAGPGDEAAAEQATDYVNKVVAPECNLRRQIEDALHDALLLRNGILKWYWEEKTCVRISRHTGLDEAAFAILAGDDSVEVLEYSEKEEQTPQGPMVLRDAKIRREFVDKGIRIRCVPRERFLIHPDAVTLEDSLLTGEKCEVTRSELVQMGYDRDVVDNLPIADDDDEYETDLRRDFVEDADESHKANEQVDYYDLYVRYDEDGDGIAELRRMVFAGGLTQRNLLVNEECDDVQFADIRVMTQPHQWEGISLADDLMDIQRVKTVLLRQTLDNIYWQNNLQPVVQKGAVTNLDAVLNPEFGKPIYARDGTDARAAVNFLSVPFVAQQSFGMLEYMDQEAESRTGVSDASAGLAPDALQNMTATASEMLNQASIGQTEMMVRTVADGLRRFFQGLLRSIIRHQDVPRIIRLRDEWVEFDPRHWNAKMDCTVNIGLGAGTRERDMQVMQVVMNLQEKLLASLGPDNPFVKPENVWQALSRMVEAAGLRTPEMYFTEPDPQEVAQKMQQQGENPEAQAKMQQAQAEMQMKQQQAQMEAQMRQQEMQAELQRKREQMEAEFALRREQMQAEMQLKREQMQMEMQLKAALPSGGGLSDIRMGGAVG